MSTTQSLPRWNCELLGNPPGSLLLKCPNFMIRGNPSRRFPLSPEQLELVTMWSLQSAYRIRAAHRSVRFYAQRAEQCRAVCGTEMPYWLSLQASLATAEFPSPDSESVIGLTEEDLPNDLSVSWLPRSQMQAQRVNALQQSRGVA